MKRILAGALSVLIAFWAFGPVSAAPSGSRITVTGPTAQSASSSLVFFATVRDANGAAVPNESVTWSITGPVRETSGRSSTNGSGVAQIVLTPTNAVASTVLRVTGSISIGPGLIAASTASMNGPFFDNSISNFVLIVDAPSVAAPGRSLVATATLKTTSGIPVPGATINWRNSGVGLLLNSSGVTDGSGRVTVSVLFGVADNGITNLSATAVLTNFEVKANLPITVGSTTQMSASISQAGGRIRVEVVGAKDLFVLVEIDGAFNLMDVKLDRQVGTFPVTASRHEVSVFIDDVLIAQKSLSFPNFTNSLNKTITCRALDSVLTVTGQKPSCPSPFKLSSKPMPSNAKVTVCFKPGVTIRMAKPLTKCPPGYSK